MKILAGLGLAAALLLGGLLFYPGGAKVKVDIPPGLSAAETARLLRREGVLRSATAFKLYAKLTGADRSLKPGGYTLRRGMALATLVRRLREGDVDHVRVVIPEGFMAKQIADRLEAAGVTSSADFMRYVVANNLEGYLFPTTYFLSQGMPAEKVAHHMHAEFRRLVEPEFAKRPPGRLDFRQTVILASIVQREARIISEMPMIAAVYRNRLKARMRLEADPTVQYALGRETGEWKKNLRYKHLETLSPYNTYAHFGLPPGPICSPGLDAVRAVLEPAQTDALYFVADNSGGHAFSRTLEEHNRHKERAKKQRWLEKLRLKK